MTTYNGEKYLQEQIDSILKQTIKDFELIICDDCSNDSTLRILRDFSKKDKRIKLFFNEKNIGFKKNFEKAISLCSNELISLSDQDDIWEPNHLEKLLGIIGDFDLACGNAELINSNGSYINLKLSDTDFLEFIPSNNKILYRILCHTGCFQGASMLIKKTLLEKALPIPDDVFFHDAWFSACACCNNGINYTFEIVTKYRQHDKQITNHTKDTYIKKIYRLLIKLIKKEEYNTDRLAYIEHLRERFCINAELSIILENSKNIQLLKAGKLSFINKIKTLNLFIKHYNEIYTQSNNKYKLSRILRFIF